MKVQLRDFGLELTESMNSMMKTVVYSRSYSLKALWSGLAVRAEDQGVGVGS